MVFAHNSRKGRYVMQDKRHALSELVSEISRSKLPPESTLRTVKDITKRLLKADPKIHRGAAVGIAYAISNFKEIEAKTNLSDNVKTVFIYGGVARGLKDDRLPKDIDIIAIVKEGADLPKINTHPRVDLQLYNESMFSEESLTEDTPQAAFNRRILVMPILPLFGEEYLKNLIGIASDNLKFVDFNSFLEFQLIKRRNSLWRNGQIIPTHDDLKKQLMEELGISDLIMDLLLSKKFNHSNKVFGEEEEKSSEGAEEKQ